MKNLFTVTVICIFLFACNNNKSTKILDALVVINQELERATEIIFFQNQKVYDNFVKAEAENPQKAGPWKRKAFEIKDKAEGIHGYIEDLKVEIVLRIDEMDPADPYTRQLALEKMNTNAVENIDDTYMATTMMIKEGEAAKLKEQIDEFRDFVSAIIKPKDSEFKKHVINRIDIKDGIAEPWEVVQFEHLPAIVVICNLSLMQSTVRNVEAEIITYLEFQK